MDILATIGERAILATTKLNISQERIDNIAHIIGAIERHGVTRPSHVAYILATVAHESAFRCIEEIRAQPGTEIRRLQDRYWPSNYYGRGFCQLTWDYNYKKFGNLLAIPLLEKPELALQPDISADILVMGMKQGLFTGKSLSDYLDDEATDFRNARRVVNGMLHADRVEAHAKRLLTLLQ